MTRCFHKKEMELIGSQYRIHFLSNYFSENPKKSIPYRVGFSSRADVRYLFGPKFYQAGPTKSFSGNSMLNSIFRTGPDPLQKNYNLHFSIIELIRWHTALIDGLFAVFETNETNSELFLFENCAINKSTKKWSPVAFEQINWTVPFTSFPDSSCKQIERWEVEGSIWKI